MLFLVWFPWLSSYPIELHLAMSKYFSESFILYHCPKSSPLGYLLQYKPCRLPKKKKCFYFYIRNKMFSSDVWLISI